MMIHAISSVNEANADELAGKTVIVIDVLRATSTIITALVSGAAGIVPVETVNQAKQLQRPGVLLGGERYCKRIPGFDLGNSPYEYMENDVAGKTVVMTTTNGTRAVQKGGKAAHLIVGALLNATACAEKAVRTGKDIVLLCAGTNETYSLEDGLCAGLIAHEIVRLTNGAAEWNDLACTLTHAYRHMQDRLPDAIASSSNGKRLTRIGFKEDVDYCCEVNRCAIVPVSANGIIRILPERCPAGDDALVL